MKVNYRLLALTAIASGLSVTLIGCETKVSQCNKLNKVANAATTEMQETSKSNAPDKIALLKKMSGSLDGYSKQVKALALEDEKLQGFQKRFVDLYQAVSSASQSLAAAADKKDLKAAQTSLAEMTTGASQETALISEVNQYCGAK